jgi:hypothetical protein
MFYKEVSIYKGSMSMAANFYSASIFVKNFTNFPLLQPKSITLMP